MDISDIERMTLGWNRYEINALKKFIETRNKVKNLIDEKIREERRYKLFLSNRDSYSCMAPINPDEEKEYISHFDWEKLKYLEGIYEMINAVDSMGSHDYYLWSLHDSMTKFIEEELVGGNSEEELEAGNSEEELEAGNSKEELEAENSEEEVEAEECLRDTEEDNGEPTKKIKLEEVQ